MKKLSLLLVLAQLLLFSSTAASQEEDVKKLPGYVDFNALEVFKTEAPKVEVYIRQPLLSLVGGIAGAEDPNLSELLSSLKLIQVQTFSIDPAKKEEIKKNTSEVIEKLGGDKWDTIVRVEEQGTQVHVCLKPEKDKIAGLFVMAVSGGEAALVNIVGNIDLESIGKLSNNFNMNFDISRLASLNGVSGRPKNPAKGPKPKPLNIPLTLVASWAMDENEGTTLDDATTNGNDGTIHSILRTQGKFGSALEFDGIDSYVNIPDSDSLDIEKSITLEAWVYPKYETWPDRTYAISKDKAYALAFKEGNLYMSLHDGNSWRTYISPAAASLNQWNHIAGTFDGATVKLYLNGAEVHSEELPWELNINKNDYYLRIGSLVNPQGTFERFFKGTIDEVKIYQGAETAEQISGEYEKAKR